MLTSLLVAIVFRFQLLLGPALVIVLVAALTVALRFPTQRKAVSGFLIVAGLCSAIESIVLAFSWGFIIGLITVMIGFSIGFFYVVLEHRQIFAKDKSGSFIKRLNTPRSRKSLYAIFAILIVACSLLISLRTTGIVREERLWVEKYNVQTFGDSPNVAITGNVTSVEYNYEVNTGYGYHIFPACITVFVNEIVWSNSSHGNYAIDYQSLNHQNLVVYCEKTLVPNLTVGQQVEVKGVYCVWLEDSMYSCRLAVSPAINGSYLNPL